MTETRSQRVRDPNPRVAGCGNRPVPVTLQPVRRQKQAPENCVRRCLRRLPRKRRLAMSDHVYKHIDVTGSSTTSSDDAVRRAIGKAGESIRGMNWFKVLETRGYIEKNAIKHWQVTVQIGFAIED
jgi:dodecin